jgi:hypothetical protein
MESGSGSAERDVMNLVYATEILPALLLKFSLVGAR